MVLEKKLSPSNPRDRIALKASPASGEFRSAVASTVSANEAHAFDHYEPDSGFIAPISVRSSFMELLWICGDCGEHYPRARACPESCDDCGAPKQHFYAPLED